MTVHVKLIDGSFSHQQWNDAARHPMQSWEWGEARKHTGVETVRIGQFNAHELHHVFQITLHPIPHTPFRIGYLPRSVSPTAEVMDFFAAYAKKNRLIFIKIEPYEKAGDKTLTHTNNNIVPSPHPLFPSWTQVLDLRKTEQQLMAQMKPKTRYNIRLAEKKGVTVKEVSNEEGFHIFSKLYFDTCKRQKYFGHTEQYHSIIWNTLKNSIAHILIAYYADVPVAAYELFHFHDTLYYPYGGTSDLHRNVMGANLIMWETIKLGKRLNVSFLDMWGSLPPHYDPNNDWAGFTRFKEGYGTAFMEFSGSFDLVADPLLYRIYNGMHQMRSLYLRIKKFS